MDKYYITAELDRAATKSEDAEIGVKGAQVYVGRVKAIIEASTWQEAMERGKEKITKMLKPGIKAINWGWMPIRDAEKMGDADIYKRTPTAGSLVFFRGMSGMTQRQLAEKSGVNIRQIQRVESGTSTAANLTAKNLIAIADALGADPHDLI